MNIEQVTLSTLIFDPSNARKHSAKNLEAIKGSLTKFGQQKPVVINKKNVVIAGNGTIAAAKALGWETIGAVVTDLDDFNASAFALADNRTAELAEWDSDILSQTLKSLKSEGFAITDIGFDDDFIVEIPTAGLIDEDEVPEISDTRCKLGDLWELGNHRMLCGDSTDVLLVDRLMAGAKADMVFTDPPYGIDLDTDYKKTFGTRPALPGRKRRFSSRDFKKIEGDAKPFDPSFILAMFNDTEEVFLWGANYYWEHLPNSLNGSLVVWDKRPTEKESLNPMHGAVFELCWSKQKHQQLIARITWNGINGA